MSYNTFTSLIDAGLCVSNIELIHDRDPVSGEWHRWYNVNLETTAGDQDVGLQVVTCTMSDVLFEKMHDHVVGVHIRHTYQSNL